ncbi:restriction endonuclease subunit S [Agathobaculum sp. LCP25S3_E8]|uniref:restriction endonuclease subunit S n=1 Tax=Agathobaculum sp. LCP25S3_E8 TaxID=3438735 RepID=UPI003F938FCB
MRQCRHRRRWYLKGADNTPYEKIDGEVRSLADEVPFDIPDSWEWVTLQTIATSSLGKTLDKAKNKGNLKPYLCSINVYWDGIDLTTVKEARLEENELPKYLLRPGDLLICEGGDVGRSAVWESTQEMYYQNALHRVRFYGGINPHYFQLLLECYKGNQILDAYSKGMTIKHLVQTALNTIVFPLPPLSEQNRIVNAVKRLLPYLHSYDKAEQKLTALNTGFPEALKKSILQEAVQGKLVPQDPSDEPAEALLERIRVEKQRLIKEGKIKKNKHESVIFRRDNSHYEKLDGVERCIDDELPFEIPESWAWVRLGSVLEIARGGSPRPIQQYLTTEPDGINWIKIGDTDKGGKYIYKTKEKIRPEGVTKSRMVHSGDFLLTNSMSFGRPYILKTDGCIHDGWLVLSNRFDCYSVDFLYYILSSPFAYYQFCDSVSGAVVKNLNSDKVSNALFPLPPLNEQRRIVQRIEELFPLVKGL